MTNRDKKDSIRGRMADAGEPFNVARRKVEAAAAGPELADLLSGGLELDLAGNPLQGPIFERYSQGPQALASYYHWRLLPGPVAAEGVFAEFGGLDGAVAHWEGSAAVRDRLQALRDSSSRLVLFLEHVPRTLAAWIADQDVSAFSSVDAQLADTTAFMRERGLVHFDAHFLNILTDGQGLYFSDFGLALSNRFDLSDQERAFLREHRCYDRDYTAAHLVNHHVAERVRGERNRRRFVRAWAAGDRPRDVPASAAAILTRHAGTAVVFDAFHQSLMEHGKQTPYPRAELERIRARAGQPEGFTTDIPDPAAPT